MKTGRLCFSIALINEVEKKLIQIIQENAGLLYC